MFLCWIGSSQLASGMAPGTCLKENKLSEAAGRGHHSVFDPITRFENKIRQNENENRPCENEIAENEISFLISHFRFYF
jgi:hypothetical protein